MRLAIAVFIYPRWPNPSHAEPTRVHCTNHHDHDHDHDLTAAAHHVVL